MADEQTTLADLKAVMAQFVAQRRWAQFHTPKNLAMGLAIEAAELMEHFLWTTPRESRLLADDPRSRRQIQDEMADVLSFLLALADTLDLDLADAFTAKMRRNRAKYPARLYRGKAKLD